MRAVLLASAAALVLPHAQAQDAKAHVPMYVTLALQSVESCVLDLELIDLGLQLHQLRPDHPSALSPQAAARKMDQCSKRSAQEVRAGYAEHIEPRSTQLAPACLAAAFDLHGSVVAHFETFATDLVESMQAMSRRIRAEARALRSKASRTKLVCA